MLEIKVNQLQSDITVLEISGRITIGRDSKELEWAVEKLIAEGRKKVIFDLTGVSYIDSTGIGIVIMSASQVKNAGGELRAAGADGHVKQVLNMTKVDQIVALYPTTEAAVAGFTAQA